VWRTHSCVPPATGFLHGSACPLTSIGVVHAPGRHSCERMALCKSAPTYIHRSHPPRSKVHRTRKPKPRGSKSPFCAYSPSNPAVPSQLVVGNCAVESDIGIPIPIQPVSHRILTGPNGPHRESARTMPRSITRLGRPSTAAAPLPLQIERIIPAACLRIADLNDGSASRAARILDELECSPAGHPDESEIVGMTGRRRVALKSPPVRRLPRGGGQKAHVAGDFNLRRVVHAYLNRASPVPPAARYRRAARQRISICGLYERV
jgi:hypothetical protein